MSEQANQKRDVPRFVGLVIDKATGTPKFDEPEKAPEPQKAMITDEMLAKMDPDLVRRLGMDNADYVRELRGRYDLKPIGSTENA